VLLVALSALASAQSPGPRRGRPPGRVELADSATEVSLATPGDRPIVDVWINGRGPFKLGVETGNPSALTLYTDALWRLGTSAPDTSNNAIPHVDSVRAGGLTLRDVDVVIPGPSLLPTQLDGQLGLAAYAQLLITVDWPRRRLRFSRDTLPATNNTDIIPLAPIGPIIGIPLTLGTHAGTFILDTQGGVHGRVKRLIVGRVAGG
jgi:hypothetical protein